MDAIKEISGDVKVLVAEDNLLARVVLQNMFEELDCEVVAVNNGREAVEQFNHHFDIVFIDYNMPVMNGDEAAKVMRQKEIEYDKKKSAYIVGLTANNSEGINRACLEAGINEVMKKPINPQALKKLLETRFKELTPIQR